MKIFLKNQFVFYQKNSEARIDNFDIFQRMNKSLIFFKLFKKKRKYLWVKKQQSIAVNQSSSKNPVWVGS